MRTILPIILVFLSTFGFISNLEPPNMDLLNKLKQLEKKKLSSPKPIPFIDLKDKKVVEEQIRKIKRYKAIQGETVKHLIYKEGDSNPKDLRFLEDYNVFENVKIVDPNEVKYETIQKWFVTKAKQFSSNIILYPYSFDITQEKDKKTFEQGAFISLNPEDLTEFGIKTNIIEKLKIKKARALFDADIAILNINGNFEYMNNINYFDESIDWCTYFQTYLNKGNCLGTFDEFMKSKTNNPQKTWVTWVNETDIIKGSLMNEGQTRFGILIISDYLLGAEQLIKSKLTQTGINQIKEFYNNGGIIFVCGKSGYLFEDFGLITSGTYDTNKILSINTVDRKASIKGCNETFGQQYNNYTDNFNKHVVCLSMSDEKKVSISSTFLTQKKDKDFQTLISIDSEDKNLTILNPESGELEELSSEEKSLLPLVLFKNNNKNGQLFVLNFNPMYEGSERNIIFNLLSLALSKELYLTSKVVMSINGVEEPNMPIPAGEAGIDLNVSSVFHNLNDKPIRNCKLYIFLPDNFNWTTTQCKERSDFENIPQKITNKRSFKSSNNYLLCDLDTVSAYKKFSFFSTIRVLNYKATQMKTNVIIMESIGIFMDANNKEKILVEPIKTNCEAASLLRVAINPDPSVFYPLHGEGDYIDNVVKIENKEQTGAFETKYVGIIPLVSPLTDGDDQRVTQWRLKIYAEYYNSNNFEVPLTSDDATDYIYTASLQGKGVVIVAEWDSPVLPVKERLTSQEAGNLEGLDKEVNIRGINMGLVTIDKNTEILKQINYRNSDRFYKLASQRLMVFVDDTTPEGTKALYGSYSNIDENWKDVINGDRAKKEFIFVRTDLYFYNNENYVNPPNITEEIVFSVDKLIEYRKNKENCAKLRGEAESKVHIEGYFDNFKENHKAKILEPNIYTNELFEYCNLTVIDPTNGFDLKSLFGDSIKLTHYIIPNVDESIEEPKQIYNFIQDNKHLGHHEKYKDIKFLYLHTSNYIIKNTWCLYGGRITISLGQYKIKTTEEITVSPDQIAIYKTEYKDNKIEIYFRRGLMSNEQFGKDMSIAINIENLTKNGDNITDNVSLPFKIEEMIYDITSPQTEYEKYHEKYNGIIQFLFKSAWSYPALEITTNLNRTLNGYETIEPFSRYGVYYQELNHRYVFGFSESHNEKHPGLVINGGGMSVISNLGISSIPFIEYLTVGRGQVIPAGTSTARVSWKDIWGRVWHQPLRSVFPDIPPIPPPVKSLMMTTTYEILQDNKQIYEWPSDENAQIHLHIKFINNFQKYFEITRCYENQIRFVPNKKEEYIDREYSPNCTRELKDEDFEFKENVFIRQGGYASYGTCFTEEGAIVGGEKVEGEFLKKIEKAKLCANLTNATEIANCERELEGITELHKVSSNSDKKGKNWNYSPRVEKYYPTGYIEDDMWDLSHIDYDDTPMDKAYRYHMDNQIPNYDNLIIKPHNTIAIPIYKGLGYTITYDKNNAMNYHGKTKRGWWGDNLQNKDDTLVAGQDKCNKISVDKESSLPYWVDGKNLKGNNSTTTPEVNGIVEERNKNIYVCLYNRKRPAINPDINKKYYVGNVYQNNVVPIIVNLEKNDPRLTQFKCEGEQYTPDNLYQLEDNLLVTPTSKDYLYFAVGLRGEAKESFNVLMNLNYFDKVKYDGMIKVNEGGRFVYWVPLAGPNAYVVVDDPGFVANSKRNDIEIISNLFPQRVNTFNAVIYHSYIIRDPGQINKIWPFSDYYANSYGFGDVTVSVYVGGIKKSKAVVNPGGTTYAKIIFYNNCGFDWNMKGEAIDFEYKDTKPINAYDLLYNLVHTIQAPKKYNFLNYTVEDIYQEYISIGPSAHNIEVAPEFFDFENINVVTIRDGFKGEYNLQINITKEFPAHLRGKPIEIKVGLNTSYFDHFPGTDSDPIKYYHNYNVKIPSIYIAVPYGDENEFFKGKVLYTSAQIKPVNFSINLGIDWSIDGIKYVSQDILDQMAKETQNSDSLNKLNEIWNGLDNNNISYTEKRDGETKAIVFDGFKADYPYFPKINKDSIDEAEIRILVRSSVSQIESGNTYPIDKIGLNFKKWNDKDKYVEGQRSRIYASGPWILMSYSRTLVEELQNGTYVNKSNQNLYHDEEGIMRVNFVLTNNGNGQSYNTRYQIVIENNLTYIDHYKGIKEISIETNKTDKSTILTFDLNAPINKQEKFGSYIYLKYHKYIPTYNTLTEDEYKNLPEELKVTKEASAIIGLSPQRDDSVTQHIRTPLTFAYQKKKSNTSYVYLDLVITGSRRNPTIKVKPRVELGGNQTLNDIYLELSKIDYTDYSKGIDSAYLSGKNQRIYKFGLYQKSVKDRPNKRDINNKKHTVKYFAQIIDKDGDLIPCENTYYQENIGLSTFEKVLISLSVFSFVGSFIMLFFAYKNLKLLKQNKNGSIDDIGLLSKLI